MNNNLDEAQILEKKESIKQEIEQKVQIILDKYFKGRN